MALALLHAVFAFDGEQVIHERNERADAGHREKAREGRIGHELKKRIHAFIIVDRYN